MLSRNEPENARSRCIRLSFNPLNNRGMLPPAKVIINNNRGYAICVANCNKLSGKFTFYSTIRFIGQKNMYEYYINAVFCR